jgi:DNA-directed RNA polymerase specialized sigma24 family protein
MLSIRKITTECWSLVAQADLPPSVVFGETELDLWPYRPRTAALLRRYARASVEIGRLPSLLGREFFRSRVTAHSMRTFEDTVVFVTDVERTLEELDAVGKKLLTMHVLEEYTISEISRLLSCSEKTSERRLHDAIDQLSRVLLSRGLLERLPQTREEVNVAHSREQ